MAIKLPRTYAKQGVELATSSYIEEIGREIAEQVVPTLKPTDPLSDRMQRRASSEVREDVAKKTGMLLRFFYGNGARYKPQGST